MATESTGPAKKQPPQKKAEVAAEPKLIHFYFPKSKGATYGFEGITVKAKNHIITLCEGNAKEAYAIEQLRKSPDKGTKFTEVADKITDESDVGKRIDKLIEMDYSALVTLLGGAMELHRLSQGELIAKALGLD